MINITGYPNSCAPYRVSDIGFRGKRIRSADTGSVDGYEMLIGGDQRSHGQLLSDFKKTDCAAVVRSVLRTFMLRRSGCETLHETVLRIGVEPFREDLDHEQV